MVSFRTRATARVGAIVRFSVSVRVRVRASVRVRVRVRVTFWCGELLGAGRLLLALLSRTHTHTYTHAHTHTYTHTYTHTIVTSRRRRKGFRPCSRLLPKSADRLDIRMAKKGLTCRIPV